MLTAACVVSAELAGNAQTVPAGATAPVTFSLQLAGERREFHLGEIIPIELVFDSQVTRRFAVDGSTSGRIDPREKDVFRVEPIDSAVDPMLDYLASRCTGGCLGSFIGSTGVLGDRPFIVRLDLNSWFQFVRPGTFRLSMQTTRVTDESPQAAGAVVPLGSNTVSFEVLPRDARWDADALSADLATIDSTQSNLQQKETACRALAALDTDAAADAILARYTVDGNSVCYTPYTVGLFAASNRARVVRQMEHGLDDPALPITTTYVRTLAILSIFNQHPEYRPLQMPQTMGQIAAVPQAFTAAQIDAAVAKYDDVLTRAFPKKTADARAATIAAQPQMFGTSSATAAADLAAGFLDLPPDRQRSLLDGEWPRFENVAMLPALRVLVAGPPMPARSIPDLALRRLYQLAPQEARPIILRQIADPPIGATLTTLGILAEAQLPALDDTLVTGLQEPGTLEKAGLRADLLARYATAAIAPRVRAFLEPRLGQMTCRPQSALIEYFLRVDPGVGGILLGRALDARARTGCYAAVLTDVASVRMTPEVVVVAAAHIDDPSVAVTVSAINTLARDPSAASRALLHEKFVRWHDEWKERAAELRYNPAAPRSGPAESMIESVLVQALGRSRDRALSLAEAEDLNSLCVTDSCRISVGLLIKSLNAVGPR